MMIIKYGIKDFSRNLGFNIFIILLISLTFIACIFTSSSVSQKLKYYNTFADVLDGEGYYGMLRSEMSIGSGLFLDEVKDRKYFSDYSEYFDEVSTLYGFITPLESDVRNIAEWSYAYRGRLIYDFEPMMSEGKWLADVKPEEGLVHAVISPNDLGLKTGDIIEEQFYADSEIIKIKVKIIGVFREGSKFFCISPSNENYQEDKFLETYKIEDAFHNYYQSLYIEPMLIYNLDELEEYGALSFTKKAVMVPFKKGLTEEQKAQAYDDLKKFTGEDVPFSEIKNNSLIEVRKQLIILIPVIVGLLILTMISVLSLTAISTHKQLKNYGILYLCGGRWKQCAFINTVTITINVIFAAMISYVAMQWLTLSGILETTIVKFGTTELLICVGVAAFILLVSLIMPFVIIGKTQPTEILKAEE